MQIDNRFPTKLDTVVDVPEPFRSALAEGLPSGETVRLIVHAPAFSTEEQKSPATVLLVTDNGWLLASETEQGGSTLQKSDFNNTLFLELTSIFLFGQLRIGFAAVSTSYSATVKFDTVENEFYREAIDLILTGIDPALGGGTGKAAGSMFEGWPIKIRNEAERFAPTGQRFLDAVQWPAVFGAKKKQLAPHGGLLITERELVAISEEKESSPESPLDILATNEPKEKFGGIFTFVPRARISDFHVSHQEGVNVLALELHAEHGSQKLEFMFASDEEMAVRKAMEQMLGA
jgi:hypothetical protein